MWDLQGLINQGNRAALEQMMGGISIETAEATLPPGWALSILSEKLKVGPPVISEIIRGFTDIETLSDFLVLVRELMPEHEQDIMSQTRSKRVYQFCYRFRQKYFPLPNGIQTYSIGALTENFPVQLLGMSYQVYQEPVMRTGYLLLMSLVIYPYNGDERDQEDDAVPFNPFVPGVIGSNWKPRQTDIEWVRQLVTRLSDGGQWTAPMGFTITKIDNRHLELSYADNDPEVKEVVQRTLTIARELGIEVNAKVGRTADEKQHSDARVPLMDAVGRIVGEETLNLIPAEGWLPADLCKATNGTKYDGVGHFAQWVCGETGCAILDANYEDVPWIEGSLEPMFAWSRYNVDRLTHDWPRVKEYRQKIDRIVEWVEFDPPVRFADLLHFIKPKMKNKFRAIKNRIYDPMDHLVRLEVLGDSDVDPSTGDTRAIKMGSAEGAGDPDGLPQDEDRLLSPVMHNNIL